MLKFVKFLKTIIPYLVWNLDVESLFYVAKLILCKNKILEQSILALDFHINEF
jgi:hypothetical protein